MHLGCVFPPNDNPKPSNALAIGASKADLPMSPWVRESSYSISLHDTQVRERAPSRAHHQAGAPQHRQEALAARSLAGGGGRPPRRRAPRVTRGSPGWGRGRDCGGGRRPTGGAAAGGEGGAGAGAHCRCPSGPGRDARLPATPAMTITEPTTRMSISNQCYNDSPLFWPPCHMLGKCGRVIVLILRIRKRKLGHRER